jgi:FixJ family two-component response regulator
MAEARSRQKSIAIVDDDTNFLISLERNLRIAGFEVKTFASAEEYLARSSFALPDLLLVDLRMPGMGGVELSFELRCRGINIPIIFMTGHGQQETARELKSIGSPECLRKPFEARRLRAAILQAIQSRSNP